MLLATISHMNDAIIDSLDAHLERYSTRIRDDVGVSDWRVGRLVYSSLTADTGRLQREMVLHSSVPAAARKNELEWMMASNAYTQAKPGDDDVTHITFARSFLVQSMYLTFAYFRESLWTPAKRCATAPDAVTVLGFLCDTESPLRHYRNAFAHGTWYVDTSNGEPLVVLIDRSQTFRITENEVGFWRALSQTVSYGVLVAACQDSSPR